MDNFIEALYGQPEGTIPEEYDWFAPLLGDWEFDYKDKFIDGDHNRPQRQLKGEWIFRRVLNGIGIEDMFICPSRATRETSPQPDGEYGVGLRIYNSKTHCYDMVYACKSKFTNLCFTMENRISRVQMARESKMSYNKIGPIINRLIKDNRIKENENTRNPNLFSRKLKNN